MGQLLSSLSFRGNSDIVPEIGFDIENASPTTEESEIHDELFKLLIQPTPDLLQSFRQYEPASDTIRDAIASPSAENEDKAWNAVTPTVNMLRTFYYYSSELEKGIPTLLNVLCKDGTTKDLDRHPGLTKLFADLLDFVFEFDYIKIRSPAIQNDFSFYRRTLQRGRSMDDDSTKSNLRTAMDEDDLANRISLFIAYSTPMLKCLIDTTAKYVQSNQSSKSVGEWLASIWAVCYQTLCKKKLNDPQLISFCLKVMVVTIILYDHVDPQGAFSKCSPINVKNSLKIIQTNNTQQEQSSTANLISALRYNSKHLNDESTPKGIKNIIMAT
ncbi:hypothetical protein G6F56_001754 [Rhizopus delemar]|uniref:Protein fam49a n=1 Tax=Rhizopus stolonifer TaxID=4846 RepID=A0A367KLD0_RHIST|nr:hypothetical protein G6F56_001754 [Rhizopus delemar]RCI03016.1 Protein fam49a [Rhizopus stolonifer]